MSAKLVAEEGNIKGLVLSLEEFEEGEEVVIGRDPDACQLLIEDPVVSRKHLLCHVTPEGILLENLSATNPITVNDEEVKDKRLVEHGDVVKIGGTLFRYYTESATRLFEGSGKKASEEEESEESDEEEEPAKETEQELPPPPPSPFEERAEESPPLEEQEEEYEEKTKERRDTIFEEVVEEEEDLLAEIDFGLLDTGRWLLKVISGPNNGAEFSMHAGSSFVIGTDPNSCDIIFHDTSVSRKHVRLSVSEDETINIEDLGSKNGTHIDGEPLQARKTLSPNSVVTVGTTSFVVFDREGEMQTIIAPLLPSIVKVLQKEKEQPREELPPEEKKKSEKKQKEALSMNQTIAKPQKEQHTLSAFIIIAIITGLFAITAIGTFTLFQSEPVTFKETYDSNALLAEALAPFPNVQYSFNKATGTLFMAGHVLTDTDKKQLIYNIQGLKFIKSVDDSGVVIDEYVWQEINPLLAKNPEWRGVSIQAPAPGNFVLTGYLKTRKEMEKLNQYVSSNFPYLDLLDNKVIVEEDVVSSIERLLQNQGLRTIKVSLSNGDLTLSGSISKAQEEEFKVLLGEFKSIPGVRRVQDFVSELAPEKSMIDVTDRYAVSGVSSKGGNVSVVVDGRIVSKGDLLDGMLITEISSHQILLEKDGIKYRISLK